MRRLAIVAVLGGCVEEPVDHGVTSIEDDEGTTSSSTTGAMTTTPTSTTTTTSTSTSTSTPVPSDVPQLVRFFQIAPIVSENCVSDCHHPDGEHPQLDLSSDPRGNLVFVTSTQSSLFYVVAGDLDGSYLWHKLAGTQGTVGGSGSRMPAGAEPLTEDELDLFAAWIESGAMP